MVLRAKLCFLGIFFIIWICSADEKINQVDPADIFNYDPVNVRMEKEVQEYKTSKPSSEESSENVSTSDNKNQDAVIENGLNDKIKSHCLNDKDMALKPHFKRYIMSLVQHIEARIESSNSPVEFCMKMKASHKELILLKYFGSGSTDDVFTVFEKLDKMNQYTVDLPDEGGPIFWLEKKLGLSSLVLFQVTILLSLALIAAKTVTIRITRSFIRKTMCFLIFVSTLTTFVELYQKKVANQEKILTQDITERCPHLSESFLSRITGYLSSSVTFQDENCKEYYEAIVINPLFQVSILEAAAIALMKTLMGPMKIIGHGLKDFIVGLFKDLPLQYSAYLSVVMVVIFFILLFLLFGYTIKTPFLSLQPSPELQTKSLTSKLIEEDQKRVCDCDKVHLPQVESKRSTSIGTKASPDIFVSKVITPCLEDQPGKQSDCNDTSEDYQVLSTASVDFQHETTALKISQQDKNQLQTPLHRVEIKQVSEQSSQLNLAHKEDEIIVKLNLDSVNKDTVLNQISKETCGEQNELSGIDVKENDTDGLFHDTRSK